MQPPALRTAKTPGGPAVCSPAGAAHSQDPWGPRRLQPPALRTAKTAGGPAVCSPSGAAALKAAPRRRPPDIPPSQQGQSLPCPSWRLVGCPLWLQPRLGTHFCSYLLSHGIFSALFCPLGVLLINFCVILEVPGQSKTTISFEKVVKIIFLLYSLRVLRSTSLSNISFGPLGLSWGLIDLIFRPFWSFFGGPNISVLMYASIDVRMYGCMTILKRKRKQR